MEAPPSRYKVVEKNGRLIVIDNGEPADEEDEPAEPAIPWARDKRRAPRPVDGKVALTFPVGPGGSGKSFLLGRPAFLRLFWSATALFLGAIVAFILFGPVFVIVAIGLALAARSRDANREPRFRKFARAWLEWAVRAEG